MRFAVVSPEATGLSFWRRLHDEGHEVLVHIGPRSQRDVGTNLVPKIESLHGLLAWAKEKPTIALFDSSGYGKKAHDVPVGADEFRKAGIPTVCGGSFCDRLEHDRAFGEKIVEVIGARTPPTKRFSSVGETIAFAASVGDKEWYFKSDRYLESDATFGGTGEQLVRYLENLRKKYGDSIPNILQMKIPGVALSTACWWNGHSFVPPYLSTIEHKKFMDGDLGPSTGCSFNAVWFYPEDDPRVVQSLKWEALGGLFSRFDAPPGIYDVNAIIAEEDGPWGPAGEAYFLEWTPRMGFDSETTSTRLLDGMGLGEFFARLVNGRLSEVPVRTDVLAYSIRLSVSPYPWEHNDEAKRSCIGTPIYGIDGVWDGSFIGYSVALGEDGFYVADRTGLVGLSYAAGTSLKKAHAQAIGFVKDTLEVPSVQYRTDGGACIEKDARSLASLGLQVNKGLLR